MLLSLSIWFLTSQFQVCHLEIKKSYLVCPISIVEFYFYLSQLRQCERIFFPDFLVSPKTKLFFSYSNLTQNIFDSFVFEEISRNKYENSHETRDSREYTVFWKILGIFEKFDQEAIFAVYSIRLNQSNRVNPINPIELIRSEMANFKLFRPKLSPNRTKNGKNHPFLHSI